MAGFTPQAWDAIRRARLFRVLAVYLGASFAVIQLVDVFTNQLGLPDWFFPVAAALLLIGLPIVVTTALVQSVPSPGPAASSAEAAAPVSESTSETTAADVAAVAKHWLTWKKVILGGVLAFALLGMAVTAYTAMRVLGIGPVGSLVAAGVLEERDRIILADFANLTNDSLLAPVVTEAFRIDIAQSPVVTVAEPAYVGRVLERMEVEPGTILDAELAREAAIREGLKAVIAGEVGAVGESYVVSARLIAAESGEELASVRQTARDSEELLEAIDHLSKKIRERIGESLKTIRANPPLAEVTSSSLEALQKYSQAVRAVNAGDRQRGVALFQEAVTLDTTFAMAYRKLGLRALNASERIAALKKAYEYRDRLTDRERYLTLGTYYGSVTEERQKAITAYESLLEIYPDETIAINNLAGEYSGMREYAAAEELYRRAAELEPTVPTYWINLIIVQVAGGKLDEAEGSLARFAEVHPDHPEILDTGSELAVARGDYAAAEALVLELREKHGRNLLWRSGTSVNLAFLAALRGRIDETERRFRETISMGEQIGFAGAVLGGTIGLASIDAWFRGENDRAVRNMEGALERYPLSSMNPLDRPYLGLADFFTLVDQPERAREFLAEYEATVDAELQRANAEDVHHTLGNIALAEERYDDAIAEYRLWDERMSCSICALGAIGYAYDLAQEPDSAIANYEQFLATPWLPGRLLLDGIFRAYTYERLGALYEKRGDIEKAIYYYGRFVDLWETADPELQPRVEAARRAIDALSTDR